MNVRLLRRIAKVIQKKPREFNMGSWHEDMLTNEDADALCDLPKGKRIACTTTHCIAGWAQALSTKRDCTVSAEVDAERLLELSHDQAMRLFFVTGFFVTDECWPRKFRGRRNAWTPTPRQAAARIEHFIKTNGAE